MTQLRWPALAGGANAVSLLEAQRNVREVGAIEARFAADVRPATEAEPSDSEWRPIDERDQFEAPDESAAWPEDRTTLYYWRRTFWRRVEN